MLQIILVNSGQKAEDPQRHADERTLRDGLCCYENCGWHSYFYFDDC